MSDPPKNVYESKGIILVNLSPISDSSKLPDVYHCFICNCKIYSEKNIGLHVENHAHIQNAHRFKKYFNILPTSNSHDEIRLSCKLCIFKSTWNEAAQHIQTHNVIPWLKPGDLYRVFFKNFVSEYKSSIFRCNLCDYSYGSWFHSMEHIKDVKHNKNWNESPASKVNFDVYDNINMGQYHRFISNGIFIGDSKPYHCRFCKVSFEDITAARSHLNNIQHKNLRGVYTADLSDFKTKLPEDYEWMKKSLFISVMKDKIYCKVCDIYMIDVKEIEPHMKSHSPEHSIAVIKNNQSQKERKDCGSTAPVSSAPNTSVTSAQKSIPLSECQLTIPNYLKWIITAHNIVVGKKSLQCTICHKILNNNSAVESHLQKHLKKSWQNSRLAREVLQNADSSQQKKVPKDVQLPKQSSSISGVAGPSGTSKRNLSPNCKEQTKVQKVDHIPIVKPTQSSNTLSPNKNISLVDTQKISGFTRFPGPAKQTSTNYPAAMVTNPRFSDQKLLADQTSLLAKPNNPSQNSQPTTSNKLNSTNLKKIPSLMSQSVRMPLLNIPHISSSNDKISPKDSQSTNNYSLNSNSQSVKQNLINQSPSQTPKQNFFNQPPNQSLKQNFPNQPSNQLPKQNFLNQPSNQPPQQKFANQPPNKSKKQTFDILPSNQSAKQNSSRLNLQTLPSNNPLLNTTVMVKLHKANYLFFTKNEIYEMSPEKKRKIILSSQLSFFIKYTSDYFVYCIVCEKSVPYNLQNVYEHWCSLEHNEYLSKMEEDDQHFTLYPNQFSCLALAKEFMIDNQNSKTSSKSDLKEFTCGACDVILQDQNYLLRQHLQSESHQSNIQRLRKHCEKLCQDLFSLVESDWYSIEKYSCWPCQKIISNEVLYAEHLETKKHLNTLQAMTYQEKKRHIFDSCAVCGLLWFGDQDEYPNHCHQDAIHKDWTRSIEDRVDYLPEEASNLCSFPESNIADLIANADKVSHERGRENELIRSLELAVRRKFPNAKAYPFGSRITGLAFTNSDIDIFLDCDGVYNGGILQDVDLIDKIHHCLKLDSQAWSVENVIESSRTPIIKVYHSHSQLKCDVSFANGLSVENTKLLKYYLDSYPPCREMILFVKKWLSLSNLAGSRNITNYAISWFVIFFLQTRQILPSVASLTKDNPNPVTISGCQVGIKPLAAQKIWRPFTTKELLKEFFNYYAEFDYRFTVICPLLGTVKSKREFLYLALLPDEMKSYVELMLNEADPELFRIDSPMCIQDPYDLSHNLTKGVKKIIVNRFRKLCKKSALILSNNY